MELYLVYFLFFFVLFKTYILVHEIDYVYFTELSQNQCTLFVLKIKKSLWGKCMAYKAIYEYHEIAAK